MTAEGLLHHGHSHNPVTNSLSFEHASLPMPNMASLKPLCMPFKPAAIVSSCGDDCSGLKSHCSRTLVTSVLEVAFGESPQTDPHGEQRSQEITAGHL